MRKQFGTKPTAADRKRYADSPQWNGKCFVNSEVTTMDVNFRTLPEILYKQFCKKENREPSKKLSISPFSHDTFLHPDLGAKAIWYGHSAILLRLNRLNVFIDPMLGLNAAPISPFPVKRFSENTLDIIDNLPELDLVLISHDHYDHLDFDSIVKIRNKARHFCVALGVGRHLKGWGIEESKVTEFDWWEDKVVDDVRITFTPSRHFSGRGLMDNAMGLWGGWAFRTKSEHIWFSGDGGYGKHFVEIGKRLGPFDFGFMECGQYNERWHQIHMYPEESIQAAADAGARKIMPVHWGAFSLAQHSWTDPVERFVIAAENRDQDYCVPILGELFTLDSTQQTKWWGAIQKG